MVNRRLWFRGKPAAFRPMFPDRGQWTPTPGASSPGIDDVVDFPTHSPESEEEDVAVESTGRRLLFINQYYWPDHASTAQHLTDLAESLAARGYECHVLCGQGRYKPGAPRPPADERRNGVRGPPGPPTPPGGRGTAAPVID